MGLQQTLDHIMETRHDPHYEQFDYESYTSTNVVHVEDMLTQNSADQELLIKMNKDSGYDHTSD